MITISIKSELSINCITPEGRLDTMNSSEFEQAVQSYVDTEEYLIIDFSKCNYMSSTGIRVLLNIEKKLKSRGGALYISAISPEVFQVLEMAGLNQIFHFSETCQSARNEIIKLHQNSDVCQDWIYEKTKFHFTPSDTPELSAVFWKNQGIAGYDELGFSLGKGIAADSIQEGKGSESLFITTGNCAGFLPFDNNLFSDFRFSSDPSKAGVLVDQAVSFGHNPSGYVCLEKTDKISILDFAKSLFLNFDGINKILAFISVNFDVLKPTVNLSVIIGNKFTENFNIPEFNEFSIKAEMKERAFDFLGAKFELNEISERKDNPSLSNFIKENLTIINIMGVQALNFSEMLVDPQSWIFISDSTVDAGNQRIKIEAPNEFFNQHYKAFLTRRLYSDSVRVVIKPLHGGYSAQTFQVASYDKDGRRLRPTVLKIANRAMITREADRCKQYSLPYIFNNSAMVLGTEFFGDNGALCYNFVGIGGEQTQLRWLTKYFEEWPFDKLEPLFDKTFMQILNPWYGQTVKKPVFLFKDHDPTQTFFPNLWDTAAEQLSISPDEPEIILRETGQKLINPYWFLKNEYKKRRETVVDYYTSICHGDLNMQNILLDQDMNVYLIDFSETRPRSVVSDFARLEAIFMIEHAPTNNDDEMSEMIRFVNNFYSIDRLDEMPENIYEGIHYETMSRNYSLSLKMRQYALKSTGGDTNLVPYYIALLEWVLPIVCYYSASAEHKRLSMIVAGLLCKKII